MRVANDFHSLSINRIVLDVSSKTLENIPLTSLMKISFENIKTKCYLAFKIPHGKRLISDFSVDQMHEYKTLFHKSHTRIHCERQCHSKSWYI